MVATDTMFSAMQDLSRRTCTQVYWGLSSHFINIYGMCTESKGPHTLDDFAWEEGVPSIMQSNNLRMQRWGTSWLKCMGDWLCQTEFTELYHPQQNPAKLCTAKWLKQNSQILHQCTGAPKSAWLYACQYMVGIHNITLDETLNWITPWQKRHMNTPDISAYLQFHFYECVHYLDPDDKLPSTKYKPAQWLGVAHNVGNTMTFCLPSKDTEKVPSHMHKMSLIKPSDGTPIWIAKTMMMRMTSPPSDNKLTAPAQHDGKHGSHQRNSSTMPCNVATV